MLTSHLEVYKDKMAKQKKSDEFNKFIIDKHGIDLSKPPDIKGGDRHVMSCNEDYSAYLTFQYNRFFNRVKASDKARKEAHACIDRVVGKVTALEAIQ